VLIALVLIRISLRLVRRNHDFLVGQPVPPSDRDRVRSLLLGYAGVAAVRELVVTYVGPDQVWVLARIDIADDLRSSQVTSLVRNIEAGLKRESRLIYRVDIVTAGTERGG
jgi:divalent metal cation (Fe/Co/Zn/Cd) transporter